MLSRLIRKPQIQQLVLIRGPKKKGGGAKKEDEILSSDILNIWKDRKDIEIQEDDRQYPLWLFKFVIPSPDAYSVVSAWQQGLKHEYIDHDEFIQFNNQVKKFKAKQLNFYKPLVYGTLDDEDKMVEDFALNKLARGIDQEDLDRMLEEQELENLLEEEDDDDEGLTKKERAAKAAALAEAQEKMAALKEQAKNK